jgi:hypothetical protein
MLIDRADEAQYTASVYREEGNGLREENRTLRAMINDRDLEFRKLEGLYERSRAETSETTSELARYGVLVSREDTTSLHDLQTGIGG